MKKMHILIGSLLVISSLFLIGSLGSQSADAYAREAYEARMKARRGHCEAIGEKINDCYRGDRSTCEALPDSTAWFVSEYQELPELACTAEDRPFGSGAGK